MGKHAPDWPSMTRALCLASGAAVRWKRCGMGSRD